MHFFFEYIYYRINQFFFKRDGRTGTSSLMAVVVIQSGLFLSIYVSIMRVLHGQHEREIQEIDKWMPFIIVPVLVLYNYKKHHGKYNHYRFYWKNESRNTRVVKGSLVIASILFPWALFFLIGAYWK